MMHAASSNSTMPLASPTQTSGDNRSSGSESLTFLREVVQSIPGWLDDFTARCAMELLDAQAANGLSGSLLEIGVYGGRFCSILARAALSDGSHLVGIDPFEHFRLEDVEQTLLKAQQFAQQEAKAKPSLIPGLSENWTADRLLSTLGERARFVHIDGSHDREDVLWDLDMCDKVLAPHGIIAIDDFFNPLCLGVMEATFQFFQGQPRLAVPLAVVPGKLLLCGRKHADFYKQKLSDFASEDLDFPQTEQFRARVKSPSSGVFQHFCGSDILVLWA